MNLHSDQPPRLRLPAPACRVLSITIQIAVATSASASGSEPEHNVRMCTTGEFAEFSLDSTIGEVSIQPKNIFDLQDPKENALPYRLANRLHIRTRDHTIEQRLLFTAGEVATPQAFEESERLIRSLGYIYDADVCVRPSETDPVAVDVQVSSRGRLDASTRRVIRSLGRQEHQLDQIQRGQPAGHRNFHRCKSTVWRGPRQNRI